PAHLLVHAGDLAGTARLAHLMAHPQIAFQGGFAHPVKDGSGGRRDPVECGIPGSAVQAAPLPVGAAHPVQHGAVGVDLYIPRERDMRWSNVAITQPDVSMWRIPL